jgi:hypothetical protein
MRAALHALLLFPVLMLGACASTANPPGAPLPDARDLSEDPLDVTKLPQP